MRGRRALADRAVIDTSSCIAYMYCSHSKQEAVSLLDTSFSDIIESDSEEDIEEDPSFPLPRTESESEDDLGEICTLMIDNKY